MMWKLRCNGRYVVDALGRRVFLRGVNRPNMEYSATGHNLESETIMANIASWGCNCIRLTFAQDLWVGDVSGYRGQIDRILALAEKYGIYVVLCRYSEIHGSASEPLPTDIPAWIAMWQDIATRYRGRANLVYDIKNEPHNNNPIDVWIDAAQACVDAIRAIDDVPVLIHCGNQTGDWGNISWVQRKPIRGGNVIYDFHWYTHYGGISDISVPSLQAFVASKGWKWLLDTNMAPFIMGEVGAWTGIDLEFQWMNNMLTALNQWGTGYLAWAYVPGWPFTVVGSDWMTPSPAGQILIDGIKAGAPPIPLLALIASTAGGAVGGVVGYALKPDALTALIGAGLGAAAGYGLGSYLAGGI